MTTLVIWLLRNWHVSALACLTAFAVVQSQRLTMSQQTVLALNTKIAAANQIAAEYQETTEKNLETLRNAIPSMVAQAQANAVANYRKKFGAPVKCAAPVSVLPSDGQTGTDIAPSSTSNDAAADEFVVACAKDAGTILLWQQWATLNKIPVSKN